MVVRPGHPEAERVRGSGEPLAEPAVYRYLRSGMEAVAAVDELSCRKITTHALPLKNFGALLGMHYGLEFSPHLVE